MLAYVERHVVESGRECLPCLQVELARDMHARGPTTFPLERLLSNFWNILSNEADPEVDSAVLARQQQSAEVFMLLRSLISLRLLSQVSSS